MNFTARASGGGNGTATPAGSTQANRPASSYAMPWGKHKGKTIDQVPADYLQWAIRNAENINDEMRGEIERQLGLLPGSTKTSPEEEIRVLRNQINKLKAEKAVAEERLDEMRRTLSRVNLELADLKAWPRPGLLIGGNRTPKLDELRGVLKRWYRQLSLKFHPDRGGTNEAAIVVNEAYRTLMQEIETWEKA